MFACCGLTIPYIKREFHFIVVLVQNYFNGKHIKLNNNTVTHKGSKATSVL